jgi:hypothetical protein
MPVSVLCPHCSVQIKNSSKHAGRVVSCPACGQPFQLPPAAPVAAPVLASPFDLTPDDNEPAARPRRRRRSSAPWLLLAGTLFLLALCVLPAALLWFKGSSRPADTTEPEPIPPGALQVSATDLIAEYANEITADKKYTGKVLYVTGTVCCCREVRDVFDPQRMKNKMISSPRVIFAEVYDEKKKDSEVHFDIVPNVYCEFPDGPINGAKAVLPSFAEGVTITIRGKCDGKVGNRITLKDCKVFTPWKEIEARIQARVGNEQAKEVDAVRKAEQEVIAGPAVKLSAETLAKYDPLGGGAFLDEASRAVWKQIEQNQVFEITGTVKNVTGYGAVILAEGITCQFGKQHLAALSRLRPGQAVTIRGRKRQEPDLRHVWELEHCILVK